MKYWRYIWLILSLILIVLGFIFNASIIFKIVLFLGTLSLSIWIGKKKYFLILISFLVILCGLLITDYVIVKSSSRIPVFSYKINTSERINIYNGLAYRVWDCNGTLLIDEGYTNGYMCDDLYIEESDSNVFISHIVENFEDLDNQFVKINGKISGLTGIESLDMKAYEVKNVTVNGYVTFADNVILRFHFNGGDENLSKYEIYDNVTIIGRVVKLEEAMEDTYIVNLEDSKIINSDLYEEYQISITSRKECNLEDPMNLLLSEDTYSIYSSCMDSIVVRYSEDVVYELGFLLTSDKLEINDILEKASNVTYDSNEDILYEYDGFKIISCVDNNKKKYVIGSNAITFESGICTGS